MNEYGMVLNIRKADKVLHWVRKISPLKEPRQALNLMQAKQK